LRVVATDGKPQDNALAVGLAATPDTIAAEERDALLKIEGMRDLSADRRFAAHVGVLAFFRLKSFAAEGGVSLDSLTIEDVITCMRGPRGDDSENS
jgi:hypothetical protein